MNAILLDTNAYVAFKRGQSEAVAILRRVPSIAINTVALGELLAGIAVSAREANNRRELQEFLNSPRVVVLPVDQTTASHYAAVYTALRKSGTPIPTNDMWIAASALQHGLRLFSYDAHFSAVGGLQVGCSLSQLAGPP